MLILRLYPAPLLPPATPSGGTLWLAARDSPAATPGVPGTGPPPALAADTTVGVRGRLNVLGVRGRPTIMLLIMLLAFMVLARPGRDTMPGGPWPAPVRAFSAGSSNLAGLHSNSPHVQLSVITC